ncbi:tyrosine-type recombinase/integrase [Oceanobacillus picturae]|uniref:tyrosine-type recombinase/integrase n=1 Tax=Oceanobacillus picturae TaxID=171693 RepID=UPI000E67E6FC|nr:tyrosine-type recombinase/integrase [Oceanobacillus picturae]RIU93310.1 site-specific integrase [Oceanobacillus picturae]
MTTTNQVKDVQPIRNKQQIDDMIWSLKRHCTERDYILFLLGINSGLRVGDMLKLKVKDVKGKKRVAIQEGKTKKKRIINLNNLYSIIQEYIKTVNSEWLFPSRKGDKSISTTQAYRQLKKAGEMVDIPEGIGTHTMRKTFGYWHYKQNKDIEALQQILNHSDIKATKRYIGITEDEINNTLESFSLGIS